MANTRILILIPLIFSFMQTIEAKIKSEIKESTIQIDDSNKKELKKSWLKRFLTNKWTKRFFIFLAILVLLDMSSPPLAPLPSVPPSPPPIMGNPAFLW